jgi:nitroreductase
MTIRETIYNRKSTRKYDRTPPSIEVLEDIQNFIKGVKPLFDDIELRFDILPAEKVRAMIGAPYFLAAYSENKDHSRINTGFMLQQMDLYIQSIGLGSCWLGTAKPIEGKDDKLEFVIALGFGRASGNPHRKLSDFRRKPLEKNIG